MKKKVRISVLVSGGGSNLQSLIDTYKDSETCEIVQVISSKAGVYALERGKAPCYQFIPPGRYFNRDSLETGECRALEHLRAFHPQR